MDLTDKRLWRKALAAVHPDRGGDEEVYKFLSEVRRDIEKRSRAVNQVRGEGINRVRTFESPVDAAGQVKPWWQMGGRR